MTDWTRRSFLAGAGAIPFSAWLGGRAVARGRKPLVRYDARSPKGQAMLKTYAQAVGQMKATAEGSPKSWVFQWYTHWVKGPMNPGPKAEEIKRIYGLKPSPQRDLAQAMWDTCQAHGPGEDENFFLPWHRMYVYFFEAIIRSVTKESSFTLPYWDYSASDPKARGVIPPEFTKEGDLTYGSLYVENRNPGVNAGKPIQEGQPGDPLSTASLAECLYEPQGARQGFCEGLDFGLHGSVHVLVGDARNMGSVPYAARDPIFWLHHCNIDRLWASWNDAGRKNPALKQAFVFADGNGKKVVANTEDFLDLAKLGYSYDRLEKVPACPTAREAILAAAKTLTAMAQMKGGPVKLGTKPVKVTLEPAPGGPPALTARVASLPAGRRLYLVVKDLQAEAQPGVLYHLYLEAPAGSSAEKMKPHYVGALNFFHAAGHGGAGHGKPAKKGPEKFFSFDITDLAKALHSRKVLTDKPTLTIAPAGRPASEAKPVIGQITLVEQ